MQKTKGGTPRYSDNCLSNSKTQCPPLVTCPDANAAWNGAINFLTSGKIGRTICNGRSKIGGPPAAAIALRINLIQDSPGSGYISRYHISVDLSTPCPR